MLSHSLLQGLDDPAGVGPFQGSDADDLACEVVDGHQDLSRPQAPTQDRRGVDGPDVVGIPSGNRAGFWFLFHFLRGGSGSTARFRPLQDVLDGRGGEENTQQSELMGDSNTPPSEIRLGDFPHERRNFHGRLVRGGRGRLLIFDLVQPSVERGSGDTEIPENLPPGDLEGLHMPENEESLPHLISWLLALLTDLFLKDRNLHFELIDPVFKEENLSGFGVAVHVRKAFEASLADSS